MPAYPILPLKLTTIIIPTLTNKTTPIKSHSIPRRIKQTDNNENHTNIQMEHIQEQQTPFKHASTKP